MKLTPAEENYILAIHTLSDGGRVSTNELAAQIGTAPASVTDMIQRLAEKEYVRYEKYKGVNLLPTGEIVANQLLQSRETWKNFLIHQLQVSENEVADLVEELSHIQSNELLRKIKNWVPKQFETEREVDKKSLENENASFSEPLFFQERKSKEIETKPQTTVYHRNNENEPQRRSSELQPLSEFSTGDGLYLLGVSDINESLQEILEIYHLQIGHKITITKIFSFDSSMLIEQDGQRITISSELARILLVKKSLN